MKIGLNILSRLVCLNGFSALIFVLMAWVNVTHAYEHEHAEHAPQTCEICFIAAHSSGDSFIDETHEDFHVNGNCQLVAVSSHSPVLILLHKHPRAPPIQLISFVN